MRLWSPITFKLPNVSCGFSLQLSEPPLVDIYCFNNNMHRKSFFFWSYLFGVLCAFYILMGMSFLNLGRFSIIHLKIWSMPLTWDFFPSSMSIVQRFGIFRSSWMFLLCVLTSYSVHVWSSIFNSGSLSVFYFCIIHSACKVFPWVL